LYTGKSSLKGADFFCFSSFIEKNPDFFDSKLFFWKKSEKYLKNRKIIEIFTVVLHFCLRDSSLRINCRKIADNFLLIFVR